MEGKTLLFAQLCKLCRCPSEKQRGAIMELLV